MDKDHPVVQVGRASDNPFKNFRPAEDNAMLNSPILSRYHAQFKMTPSPAKVTPTSYNRGSQVDRIQGIELIDLGSTHGTYVGGRRLESNKSYRLSNNEDVTFGCRVINGLRMHLDIQSWYHAKKFAETHTGKAFRISYEYESSSNRPLTPVIKPTVAYSVPDGSESEVSEYAAGTRELSIEILNEKPRPFSVPSTDEEDSYESEEDQDVDDASEGKKDDSSAATTPESKGKGKGKGDIRSLLNQLEQDRHEGTSTQSPINLDGSSSKSKQGQPTYDSIMAQLEKEGAGWIKAQAATTLPQKAPTPPARPHHPLPSILNESSMFPKSTPTRYILESQCRADLTKSNHHFDPLELSMATNSKELCEGPVYVDDLLMERGEPANQREPSPSDAALMQSRRIAANAASHDTRQARDYYSQPPKHFPTGYSFEAPHASAFEASPTVPAPYSSAHRYRDIGRQIYDYNDWYTPTHDVYDIGTSVASNFGSTKTSEAAPFEPEQDAQVQPSRLSIADLVNESPLQREFRQVDSLKRKADAISSDEEEEHVGLLREHSKELYPRLESPILEGGQTHPSLLGVECLPSSSIRREVPETPQEEDEPMPEAAPPPKTLKEERPSKRAKTAAKGSRFGGIVKFLAGATVGAVGVVAALIATAPADVAEEVLREMA